MWVEFMISEDTESWCAWLPKYTFKAGLILIIVCILFPVIAEGADWNFKH